MGVLEAVGFGFEAGFFLGRVVSLRRVIVGGIGSLLFGVLALESEGLVGELRIEYNEVGLKADLP